MVEALALFGIRETIMSAEQDRIRALELEVLSLRSVLDHLGAYVFTKDRLGKYTFANASVCQLFGATLEQVVGRDDNHFFDLTISNELYVNDRRVLEHGEVIAREEVNFVRPSGEKRIYWTVKTPIHDEAGQIVGICGISTDITERKQLEKDLQRQQGLLDAIINNVDAHVYIKSQERRFLYVNKPTAGLIGLPPEQIIGRLDNEVLPQEVADHFWALDRKVFESGVKQTGEESFYGADGAASHYWTVKVPVALPDQPPALIGFSTDITELHELKEELQRQVNLDPLTGVGNRRSFFIEGGKEFAKGNRHGAPLSVLMLDIDHFKRVNDCHGHHVGDVVLKEIAARCLQCLRLYDVLGRIGGEEFAILLPNTDRAAAALTAERLCAALRAIEIEGEGQTTIRPTASIGVATIAPADQSFDCLLARADAAMYAAKQGGRDQVRVELAPD